MGLILKSLMKGVSALVLVGMLALNFAPATENEVRVLGPEPPRVMLVQTRLATAAMKIAPDRAVALTAQMTGIPEAQVRLILDDITGRTTVAEGAPAAAPPSRRTEAGGALFVRTE